MKRIEEFEIKYPKQILFGDPMYFEDYKDQPERLQELVVDYKPQPEYKACVLLEGEKDLKYPDITKGTMTVYFAPSQMLPIYMKGVMYKEQKIDQKKIGVDSAKYRLSADGRGDDIKTGDDGCWGSYEEFYREINGRRCVDTVIISGFMPDNISFKGMKGLAHYLFESPQPRDRKNKIEKSRGPER